MLVAASATDNASAAATRAQWRGMDVIDSSTFINMITERASRNSSSTSSSVDNLYPWTTYNCATARGVQP